MKKLKSIAIALMLMVVVGALAACGGGPGGKDPNTLSTLKKLNDEGVYSMKYYDDYKLDYFLEQGGASNDDELAEFLQNDLLEGKEVEIKAPDFGCSTFSGQTVGGNRLFARNFDYSPAPLLILKTNPNNGYKSISTVNLAFLNFSKSDDLNTHENKLALLAAPYVPLDGINEKGLAIGVLQINYYGAKQVDESKVDVTTTVMIRLILDKAATVDEAIALMAQYNMNDSLGANFHYQIADKSGKSVVVEYIGNVMKIVDQTEGKNYHCATNFLLHPDGTPINNAVGKAGEARYNTLVSTLEENGAIFENEQEAMDLLEAVKQGSTQWSVIYNLNKLTAKFIPYGQYSSPSYNFAL